MSIDAKVEQALLLLSEVLEELQTGKPQVVAPVPLVPSLSDNMQEVARQQAAVTVTDINDGVKVSQGKWKGEQVEVYDFGSTTI